MLHKGGIDMKNTRKARIEMRVTDEEKRDIERRAKKSGLSITEYILCKVLYSKEKRVKDLVALAEVTVEMTELLRRIEKDYAALNPDIKERIDKIWKKLP